MEKKTERVQLVMGASELRAVDDFRARNRIWSRNEAIRQLIAAGLKALPQDDSTS
jgi:hypothetical protein